MLLEGLAERPQQVNSTCYTHLNPFTWTKTKTHSACMTTDQTTFTKSQSGSKHIVKNPPLSSLETPKAKVMSV